MEKTLMQGTSDLRLPSYVATEHSACTAPNAAWHGTAVSCAGTSLIVPGGNASGSRVREFLPVQVAVPVELVDGARSTDLPGLHPRAAPV